MSEIRAGMRIDWGVPVEMDDGLVLRGGVYRPIAGGRYLVILTYGPYGKWLHFEDLDVDQWRARIYKGLHCAIANIHVRSVLGEFTDLQARGRFSE